MVPLPSMSTSSKTSPTIFWKRAECTKPDTRFDAAEETPSHALDSACALSRCSRREQCVREGAPRERVRVRCEWRVQRTSGDCSADADGSGCSMPSARQSAAQ